jgi:NADH-quinone oxidoreductase subunit I
MIFAGGKRYYTPEGIAHRMSKDARGIFTVQYPEEKLPVPEEFRFIPFLLYEEDENGEKDIAAPRAASAPRSARRSASGLCAPMTRNRAPGPEPAEFYIDVDICMNCGFCAEYCPFDAIKMDHDYELSVYNRHDKNILRQRKADEAGLVLRRSARPTTP